MAGGIAGLISVVGAGVGWIAAPVGGSAGSAPIAVSPPVGAVPGTGVVIIGGCTPCAAACAGNTSSRPRPTLHPTALAQRMGGRRFIGAHFYLMIGPNLKQV